MAIVKKISELTPKGSALALTDLLVVGVDNGSDYDLKSVTGAELMGASVSQTITDGVTTKSPSENVVYDSLALKVDKVAGSRLITSAESTILGNTSGTNTGDQDLSGKVDKVAGKGLSTEDYTTAEKSKLAGLSGTNTGDQTLQEVTDKGSTTINPITVQDATFSSYIGAGVVQAKIKDNSAYATLDSDGKIQLKTNAVSTGIIKATNLGANITLEFPNKSIGSYTIATTSDFSGTNTGDQIISDATISTTDITTNNFTTAKHGFVPKGTNVGNFLKDDGTWGTPASGSSGGIVGIANASGVYTYYATLTLAMTAAVSGNTIELFANITETGSVAITLKSGVKINGNGNTYTLSVNNNTHALICNTGTVELFNWKVIRTGRANGLGGYVLYCYGGNLKAQGVLMENTYGDCILDGVSIYNLQAKGYLNGFSVVNENTKHYNCIGESIGTGNGISSTYSVGCTGVAVSGAGITGNGTHLNSKGISISGAGLSGQTFTGCTGLSTTGTGIAASSEGRNCIGISTSGVGGVGAFYGSTLISSSNYGVGGAGVSKIYSSYVQSTSAVATSNSSIYDSSIRCLWNNSGGNCTATFGAGSQDILNSFLEVTNASAYCITGFAGSTWKYANNSFKGSTVAVNATNITQGITNTSDNQGNILI
jgi:hypothetical protein